MQNLLLVDDEKSVLSALKRSLRKQPYNLFLAESAQEAYGILAANDIHVMLTDYKMPRENGAQLIKNVAAEYPDVVSLMLSGQADYERVVDLLSCKAALKFIKKPWATNDIVNVIHDAFSHYYRGTHSSWHQRVNVLSSSIEMHTFERSVTTFSSAGPTTLCLMQINNIIDFSASLGQAACEKLQSELVSSAQSMLSSQCISHCYAAGLVAYTFPQAEEMSFSSMLNWIRSQLLLQAKNHCDNIKPDIRFAYRIVEDNTLDVDRLLEELKQRIQTTSIMEPLTNLDADSRDQLARERLIRQSMQSQLLDGRFSLVAQPKVTLKTMQIEEAEVLLRWHHSDLGWLLPNEFIKLAEVDGQINQLGTWVLEQGIALAGKMAEKHSDFKTLSINLAPPQLLCEDFIPLLQGLLSQYQVQPQHIELEITETNVSRYIEQLIPTLNRIKQLGVKISIDDFGAGETAYHYLADVPIDTLKLDRCMITDLSQSENKQVLVRKLIECCHGLGIKVVAEGAEDQATLDILMALNCDYVQGFVFSPPLAPDELEEMLATQPFAS